MMNSKALVEELVRAGVSLGTVVRLDAEAPGPEHLRYVDLLHSQTASDPLPDAVVESSGQPFAYVVRRERLGGEASLSQAALEDMVRTLACRSDARYLCVVGHSSMDVYPISFVRGTPAKLVDAVRQQSPTWLELLSRSVPLGPNFKTKRADQVWVEDVLFRLLVEAARGVRTPVDEYALEDEVDGNLGSLSGKIRNELKSEFDVVLGNPPWTGIGGSAADALDNCLSELTREVAADPARAVTV